MTNGRSRNSAGWAGLLLLAIAALVHVRRTRNRNTRGPGTVSAPVAVARADGPIPAEKMGSPAGPPRPTAFDVPLDDWSDPQWEPFKIALGTLYALCLQRGFDSTVNYFQRDPVKLSGFYPDLSLNGQASAVIAELVAYVIWLSLFFLYNARLYLLLPRSASRARVTAYASLTLSFGAFYFFAASIGPPERVQVLAISLILVVDIIFPLHLGVVTKIKARVWWIFRDCGQIGVAFLILALVPDNLLERPVWVYTLLGLLLVQLVVAPREYRHQLHAHSTI